MRPTDEELVQAYRAATRPQTRDGCPSSSEIASLALDGTAPDHVVEHIRECAACAEEVHAVREPAPHSVRMQKAPKTTSFHHTAIAALLILTIGIGGWAWILLHRTRDLQVRLAATQQERAVTSARSNIPIAREDTPVAHINVPIIDLEPPSAVIRGDAGISPVVDLPPADAYTLILNIDPQRQHEDYGLDIVDAQGRAVWRARGLRRSDRDTFTLTIERGLLGAGQFRVDLHAIDGEATTPLESYAIRLPNR